MYLTSLCILLTTSVYAWKDQICHFIVIKFEQIEYSYPH